MMKPYKSWWWRRQGINGVGAFNPSDLNPSEHYKEDGWSGSLDWIDSVSSTRKWSLGGGTLAEITKNGLTCYENSAGGYMLGGATPAMGTWVQADNYITMYFVARWDGATTEYIMQGLGDDDPEGFVLAMTTGDRVFTQIKDGLGAGQTATVYPVEVYSSGWQVWAVRVKNITDDAEVTIISKQGSPNSDAIVSYFPIEMNAGQRLFTNDGEALDWSGAIAEIIVYRDNHSDETMLQVNEFLQTKWNIA